MKLNRKNKLLIIFIFLALILCYNLAIKKTFDYYNQYNSEKEIIDNTKKNPFLLSNLLVREKQINQWLNKNDNSNSSFQSKLLKQLNQYSAKHNLKIIDFREPHSVNEKQTEIKSYIFSIEGSFNATLGLINNIENNPNLGHIKHLSTEKKMNYKTNQEVVVTFVIIQKN